MTTNEIYPNPTVRQVIFQIRFPNLFYLEAKIGDFQMKIMDEFPHSELLVQRDIILTPATLRDAEQVGLNEDKEELGRKIFQFRSDKNYKLNVQSNSLDITSEHHKTYDIGDGDKFRDVIQGVLNAFFEVVSFPIVTRIGLRYIDECPLPNSLTNKQFFKYYNSTFSEERFNIKDTNAFLNRIVTKRGKHNLSYAEELRPTDNGKIYILDFDGFSNGIDSSDCLKVTDELHTIVSNEYFSTIKEPVIKHMRKKK